MSTRAETSYLVSSHSANHQHTSTSSSTRYRPLLNHSTPAVHLHPAPFCSSQKMEAIAPLVVPGYEPSPTGAKSDEERAQILNQMKQMRLVQAGIESPVAKAVMSGGVGQSAAGRD